MVQEYGLKTDSTGRYAAMYKPYHLIGLELGISVASVALRGEPTGAPRAWIGDVAAIAKRDLASGESLDGEGGFTVYGRLMPAQAARAGNVLPIGLAHGAHLQKPVPRGCCVRLADVQLEPKADLALSLRSTLTPTALAA
jgi:predicted homoserine dehydrogenase-like protein